MARKLILGILITLVVVCVGVILAVAFLPRQTKEIAQKMKEGKPILARKPPPRPTPLPGTPTPIPTPESKQIARRLRVKPTDYPFGIASKADLPNGKVRITLNVKNDSGQEWPVAYLTLSSAYHLARTNYRIDNWHKGEARTIDYVFPSSELRERLRDLRVEDVSSVPPTEALSDAEAAADSGPEPKGTLGLWGDLKRLTGVPPPPPEEIATLLTEASPDAAKELKRGTGLTINLEGLGRIEAEPLPFEGMKGADRQVRLDYNDAIVAAKEGVKSIEALGKTLGDLPWKEAMAPNGTGTTQLALVRQLVNTFQAKAVRIQQVHSQTPSAETENLTKSLEQVSKTLLSYEQALERQVRSAHPEFDLTE